MGQLLTSETILGSLERSRRESTEVKLRFAEVPDLPVLVEELFGQTERGFRDEMRRGTPTEALSLVWSFALAAPTTKDRPRQCDWGGPLNMAEPGYGKHLEPLWQWC